MSELFGGEACHAVRMAVPQYINLVTFGSRDVARLRDFYEGWGWAGRSVGDGYVEFEMGSLRCPRSFSNMTMSKGPRVPRPTSR